MLSRPLRRILIALVGLVVFALIFAAVASVVATRRPLPETAGAVRISGLDGPIDVKRDSAGIPQIYADTPRDLFFAQGYAQAQDRFYEMDFRRRVTSGRLSEMLGKGAADVDAVVRTLGWRRVAEREVEMLDDSTFQLLEAYANGVNEYIDDKPSSKLSLEYSILGLSGSRYQPEPWTPADSVAWLKAMAWDLRSNIDDEIARVRATEKLTIDEVEKLYPEQPKAHSPIVSARALADSRSSRAAPIRGGGLARTRADLERISALFEQVPKLLGTGEGIGSNSWVVSGRLTATGKPMLAGDPHLTPSMPGPWYQVGLHCRAVSASCPYNVSGFSFAGTPGVVIGHNSQIAWSFTTMYADVADLALEKIDGDTAEYAGKPEKLTTRTEVIKIAGAKDRKITVRETRNGPLVSDPGTSGRLGVALKWTALKPRPTFDAIFTLNRAQNFEQFRRAARQFTVPSQNMIYADRAGNIGYQAPGEIPIRGKSDGRWPVPGWDQQYAWKGRIDFAELPSIYNPPSGMIVTANGKVAADSYPYQLGADTAHGYRSNRISKLLAADKTLSIDDMQRIQFDNLHPMAAVLRRNLLRTDLDPGYQSSGQKLIRSWDGSMGADSAAAAYFAATWKYLLAETFSDDLPQDQWPDGGERWYTVVSELLKKPQDPMWDNRETKDVVETRDDIIKTAMIQARDDLTRRISRDPAQWTWGALHKLELVNPSLGRSGNPLVESLFNRGPEKVSGGGGIVNATAWDAAQGYEVTAVPSMRMIVDLANFDDSRWIQLTGNSGHAFSENYFDQFGLWRQGRTLPWAFSESAVRRSTDQHLRLEPPGR